MFNFQTTIYSFPPDHLKNDIYIDCISAISFAVPHALSDSPEKGRRDY